MSRIRTYIVGGNRKKTCKFKADGRVVEAADLLKDAVADEQVYLHDLIGALQDKVKAEEAMKEHFEGCLKAAENALKYKEKVICKHKKIISKLRNRLDEKDDVIDTLNKEIGYQYKRREKAEKIIALVCEQMDSFAKKAGKVLEDGKCE